MSSSLILGLMLALVVAESTPAKADNRRPFFNIAHMVNSIPEIEHYLSRGANAIEVDVNFTPNGTVLRVYHGLPCDCYRRCMQKAAFDSYLDHLRGLRAANDRRLVLLMMDLKLEDFQSSPKILRKAGADLFNTLVDHLWRATNASDRLNVLVSIQRVEQAEFLKAFVRQMREGENAQYAAKISFDVGMNSDPREIAKMYASLGIKAGIWQGDGITNCLVELRADDRLRAVLKQRNSPTGYVSKVYYWTVDMSLTMEQILDKGVDGLITNHPERAALLINGNASLYRMADERDSPWTKIIPDNATRSRPRDPGYGIYNTIENLSEIASQAGDYFSSYFQPPMTGWRQLPAVRDPPRRHR